MEAEQILPGEEREGREEEGERAGGRVRMRCEWRGKSEQTPRFSGILFALPLCLQLTLLRGLLWEFKNDVSVCTRYFSISIFFSSFAQLWGRYHSVDGGRGGECTRIETLWRSRSYKVTKHGNCHVLWTRSCSLKRLLIS